MPRILLVAAVAVVGLLVFSPANAQTQSAVEREIIKAEQDRAVASWKKDRAAYERLTADEFIYTSSAGSTSNKVEDVAETMESKVVWLSPPSFSEVRVRVYGDVAVATYLDTTKVTIDGKPGNDFRYTDVWVKRDGRWQLVASHGSSVVKKK
jgi:ketosteroid isomerase-like protein